MQSLLDNPAVMQSSRRTGGPEGVANPAGALFLILVRRVIIVNCQITAHPGEYLTFALG